MPPKSLAEIDAAFGAALHADWLEEMGWTYEDWRGFYEHGIPEDWARDFERVTKGRVPVSWWPKLLHAPRGLLSHESDRIIRTMDVNTEGRSPSVKRGAGRATRKHAAQRKLYEKGRTVTDIAAELGEGRPRVSAWFAAGDANRPIPRRHAEKLRERYGIPLTAWARIAD